MKTIFKILTGIGLASFLYSCHKEDRLNTKLENYDMFQSGPIDEWISKNLTDPYNIEVIYRYQRNMHDVNKNIAPVDESKVVTQMEIVKKGFLEVYGKIGGQDFIKVYTPKQVVLFGSGDYDPDGSVKGGTADGGRRITLYGVNGLDIANSNSVLGNLQVIHHEFTHILNQNKVIPPEFEKVCVGDYYANWTYFENTPELARSLGFITPYARKSVGEDFAEILSHLIVKGQLYYDQYAYDSGEKAYNKFKQKEAIVRDYMIKKFNIDVTQLQMEFQRVMEKEYENQKLGLFAAIEDKTINDTLDIDIRSDWAQQNKISSQQTTLFKPIIENVFALPSQKIQLKILSSKKMTLMIPNGTHYTISLDGVVTRPKYALYDFDIVNQRYNVYKITSSKIIGSSDDHKNGDKPEIKKHVQPLLDYFENGSFRFDWGILGNQTIQNYLQFVTIQDINNPEFGITGKVKPPKKY